MFLPLLKCILSYRIPLFCRCFAVGRQDFDLTLTNVHVYNSGVKVPDVPQRFAVDVPCRDELAAVLSAIDAAVNSQGDQSRSWCVVTFGQPPVVSAYLAALGFPNADVRSPLEGSQCYGEVSGIRPPPDKNAFLAALASEKGLSHGEVALFDDDQRNVRTAIAAGFLGSAVRIFFSFAHHWELLPLKGRFLCMV